jgi:clan AA aspartic protease (TIGR02281 family)
MATMNIMRAGLISVLALSAPPVCAQTVSLQAQGSMFRATIVLDEHISAVALIDTGATFLLLCTLMARELGLELGRRLDLMTENGTIQARLTTVRSIRIGPIEIRSVTAVVKAEGIPCRETVVGMSVLHQLEAMVLKNGTLTLVGRSHVLPSGRELPRPSAPAPWWR